MSHEISQLELSGIQLRDSKTQPKVSHSKEIGEAQIVHTIFGKAKVRIIRKHDKFRRILWWTVVAGAAAASALVWQTWYVAQQTAPLMDADSVPPVSAAVHEKAAASQSENAIAPAAPPTVVIVPVKPAPVEVSKSLIGEKSVPQPQTAMKAVEKEDVKPVVAKQKPTEIPPKPVVIQQKPAAELPKQAIAQPKPATPPAQVVPLQQEGANKPQILPAAAGSNTLLKPQPIAPIVVKPIPPKPTIAPVNVTNSIAKTASPASAAVAVPVLAAPLSKDAVPVQAPVVDKQLSAPLNVQSK